MAASMEIVGQMPPMLKRLRDNRRRGNRELRYGTSLKLERRQAEGYIDEPSMAPLEFTK